MRWFILSQCKDSRTGIMCLLSRTGLLCHLNAQASLTCSIFTHGNNN